MALQLSVLSGTAGGLGGNGAALYLRIPEICGLGLSFTLDGFRAVYGCVTAFMWTMAAIFSREYMMRHHNRNRYYLFLLWTLGATMGVFLSADLYTTFLFFEIMSFTSYVWVAQEESREALRAADTYLAVAVTGGLVMLMGIFLLYHQLGTLEIRELSAAAAKCADRNVIHAAGYCMLFGFGAKAGAFPLHIWLPKAHPVAPAPASALLSGVLTKTGIYGILILTVRLFFQEEGWGKLLLLIGVATMLGGALLAVFSVDLKRTLACSSMSQIGFILVGIGMLALPAAGTAHTLLAARGIVLHMVNHSLIKLVLFMAAGVVFLNAHSLNLNDIRGFGRRKPLLAGIFLAGALAIGGIPFFGGYVSKTLLHESITVYGGGTAMKTVEALFLFSGGLTVAYMTKLFSAVFVEKNEDSRRQEAYDGMKKYMNRGTVFSLAGSCLLLLVWGAFPHAVMERAAGIMQGFLGLEEAGEAVSYFSPENIGGALISLGIGALVYLFFIRRRLLQRTEQGGTEYVDAWPRWLDLEELVYRPLLLKVLPALLGILCRILDSFVDFAVVLLRKTLYRDSRLPQERPEGNVFTEALGTILNAVQDAGNRTWRRGRPAAHRDYVHLAAVKSEEIRETNHIIQRSLSFGLLLVCIGLALTLFYIIWW
ncbi:MAG TPA: sodium:proton antiporter [Lachnospiraceae bacterium]|nr:sodium:proton antiporter [Lachnospiraceae bacterium]